MFRTRNLLRAGWWLLAPCLLFAVFVYLPVLGQVPPPPEIPEPIMERLRSAPPPVDGMSGGQGEGAEERGDGEDEDVAA